MTKRAAVIGYPITHSLSPRLHGYWLRRYAIDGAYDALEVSPEALGIKMAALEKTGITGVNLTVPHKELVLPFLDEVHEEAKAIGAANTVIITPEGKYVGMNTDAYGFMAHLTQSVEAVAPCLSAPVVIGAGGASRAICYALKQAGAGEIRLVNRSVERAEALAETLGAPISVIPWEKRHEALAGASLLINTTTQGMGETRLDLALDALPAHAPVYDIIYAPLKTDLLLRAEARGHQIINGLGMLIWQAQPAFEAFFGKKPEIDGGVWDYLLQGIKR